MTFLSPKSGRQSAHSIGDFVKREPLKGARKQKPFTVVSELSLTKAGVFRGRLYGSQRFVFDARLRPMTLTVGGLSQDIRLDRILSSVNSLGQLRHISVAKARAIVTVTQLAADRFDIDYKADVKVSEGEGLFIRYSKQELEVDPALVPLTGREKQRIGEGWSDKATAGDYFRHYVDCNRQLLSQPNVKLDRHELNQAVRLKLMPSVPTVQQPDLPQHTADADEWMLVEPVELSGSTTPVSGADERKPRAQPMLSEIVGYAVALGRVLGHTMPNTVRLAEAIMGEVLEGGDEQIDHVMNVGFLRSVTAELSSLLVLLSSPPRPIVGQEVIDAFTKAKHEVESLRAWVEGCVHALEDRELEPRIRR